MSTQVLCAQCATAFDVVIVGWRPPRGFCSVRCFDSYHSIQTDTPVELNRRGGRE